MDYSDDYYNNTTFIEYTNENIQIMLTILLFLSCVSPFIYTYKDCIRNIKTKYDIFMF